MDMRERMEYVRSDDTRNISCYPDTPHVPQQGIRYISEWHINMHGDEEGYLPYIPRDYI